MNFNEIFLGEEKFFNRKVAIFHAALIFAAVMFLYLFSYSTSPRYFFIGNDSAIFQVVGKGWAEGLLPYVNNFENKGPLLFAIDALGYLIYPRVGIFFLQIPFMYFSFLFMWRAVELYWSRRATLAIWSFMIFWRAAVFYEGNRTEEYSMPFLLAGAYFFLRWLRDENNFLPPSIGFFYGLGFGACVLLRTTNGLPICCYVLLTTFVLIRAGAFKNIWQNFLSFWAGFATICLPFVIYFASHGIFYDMLYGTILFNTKLTTAYGDDSLEHLKYMASYAALHYVPLYLLVIGSVCLVLKNVKNFLAWSGLVTGAIMFLLLVKLRPFAIYLELIAAVLPIFFAILHEWKRNILPDIKAPWHDKAFRLKRIVWKFVMVYTAMYLILHVVIFAQTFYVNNSSYNKMMFSKKMTDMRSIGAKINAAEKKSVVFYGEGNIMSYFILETGIYPRCRFFSNITNAFGLYDPAVIPEWIQNVTNDYPKWILYSALEKEYTGEEIDYWAYNFRRQRHPAVEEIIAEKYTLAAEMEIYSQIVRLYRLRE